MTAPMPRVAIGTALTANYVAYTRVLAQSLREHLPGVPLVAVVAERRETLADWTEPAFRTLGIEDFGVPGLARHAFISSPHELTVLAKPLVLRYLLDTGFDAAIFIDSDVLATGDLTPLIATCASHAVTLTPHLLRPASTGNRTARELALLRSGTFNGGCVAVARRPEGRRFLDWWLARLLACNRLDPGAGMHHDQRWLDLAPGFVEDVAIVRDPGCNVAYWNLPERGLRRERGTLVVDGGPLRYFHFSGFNAARPDVLSMHARDVTRADMGTAADLLDDYAVRLRAAGLEDTATRPYSFGSFDNGVPIPDVARRLFADLADADARFGNPFETAPPDSFYRWLTKPDERLGHNHRVPALWGEIYRLRADVRRRFADPAGRDQEGFLAWVEHSGLREHGIDARLAPGRAGAAATSSLADSSRPIR